MISPSLTLFITLPNTGKHRVVHGIVDVSSIPKVDQISLSDTQMTVLTAILQRKSVFFTGSAGTGKSYVLRVLQDVLDTLDLASKIAFTAPTGVAACNVRGLTVHSWSGVGLGIDPKEKILGNVMSRREVKARWIKTEILVIDEISMLSAEMFDLLSFIGRHVMLRCYYDVIMMLL